VVIENRVSGEGLLMTIQHPNLLSRREVLAQSLTASGLFVAARAAALPPPVASKHTTVVLLSTADLKLVHNLVERTAEFREHSPARCPTFSLDGTLAACGGSHTYAGVWDVETGKRVCKLGAANTLAFRRAGEVVTAQVGNYDAPSGQGRCSQWTAGNNEPDELFGFRLEMPTFSPDGQFLAGRTPPEKDGKSSVRVLSVPDGKERAALSADYTMFAVLAGGDRVLTGKYQDKPGQPTTIRLWATQGAKVLAEVEGLAPVVSADGKVVAMRGTDPAEVLVWDPVAGTKVGIRHGHVELSAIGLSADGKKMATAGPKTRPVLDRTYGMPTTRVSQAVAVWDLGTRKQVVSETVGNVRLSGLTFSPDAKQLMAAGSENVLGS
jgi:WD40 repeat protein